MLAGGEDGRRLGPDHWGAKGSGPAHTHTDHQSNEEVFR
jgi:hypothetical protein